MIWSDAPMHRRIDTTQEDLGNLRDCIAMIANLLGATDELGKRAYVSGASPYNNAWEYLPPSVRIKYSLQVLTSAQNKVDAP